jgi:hypothetical protein
VADWPPQGWPPPFDPALMGAPVPMVPPSPMELPWPPPEYAQLEQAAPLPPVDPVMAANEQLLAQPPAPPVEDAPWPPQEWAPPAPEAPQEATPAPQERPQRQASPPGYGGQVQQTGGLMEDSLLREGEYEAAAADKRARGMAEQARAAELYEMQAEKRAMERKADLDQRWQALQTERQEIANTKIEPQRLYADMDTGSRLAWGIAAGIAGALGTINGSGRNLVMEHINRQIDLDIDAQKANLANRRGALGDGMSLYQQLVVKYGDEEQAAGMMKAAHLDRIAHEFEAQAAQYANPIAKENALQGAVAARQQADAIVQDSAVKAEQRAFDNKMQQGQLWIQSRNAATAEKNAETSKYAAEQDAAYKTAVQQTKAGWDVYSAKDGKPLHTFRSEEQAKDATKFITNRGALDRLYRQGQELFKDGGWDNNPLSARRRAQEKWIGSWVNVTKTADGDFSAPNQFDFDSRGIPDNWGPDQVMAGIDQQYKQGKAQTEAALRARGVPTDALIAAGIVDEVQEKKTTRQGKIVPSGFDDEGNKIEPKKKPERSPEQDSQYRLETWKAQNRNQPDEWKREQNRLQRMRGRAVPWPELEQQ